MAPIPFDRDRVVPLEAPLLRFLAPSDTPPFLRRYGRL